MSKTRLHCPICKKRVGLEEKVDLDMINTLTHLVHQKSEGKIMERLKK